MINMPCSGRGSWVTIKTNDKEGEIILSKKGQNSNNKNLVVELEKKLIERIEYLVKEAKQFKSRDDFIELACHDFLVRRNPAGELHS
jgi:DNA-binding winged helix-turn-helix (wHTH) protein